MAFWLLYVASFFCLWLENSMIVLTVAQKPRLFRSPVGSMLPFLLKFITRYGSAAGLWYQYGYAIAAGALIASYFFGHITFKRYFNQQVKFVNSMLEQQVRKEVEEEICNSDLPRRTKDDSSFIDKMVYSRTTAMAEKMVTASMKRV